jgi:hypothetical protein
MKQLVVADITGNNDLPHINDITPLNDADMTCVNELRDVLKKHGALDRFGITLLHKHFDIEPDEVLVERTDEASKVQTIRPYKKAELDTCIQQTAWRLSDDAAVMGCYTVCIRDSDRGWHQAHVTSGS